MRDTTVVSAVFAARCFTETFTFGDLCAWLATVAPGGYDGLVPMGSDVDWRTLLRTCDPEAFRYVLGVGATQVPFDVALMRLGSPAYYIGTDGYRAWWRVAFALLAYYGRPDVFRN